MAVVRPVFFDTSALLSGLIDLGPPSDHAQAVMDGVVKGRFGRPQTAWHCCLEFFAVSTRLPEEFRLTPEDALRLAEEELLRRFDVHELPQGARTTLFRTAAQERLVGGRIYDAHIADIALRAGARTVVTDNTRHFAAMARYGVTVVGTAQLARQTRVTRGKA